MTRLKTAIALVVAALGLAGLAAAPASAQQRGYELVSPADGQAYDVNNKLMGFQGAQGTQSRRTTPSGEAAVYELRTNGTLAGMALDGDANDPIVARRTSDGWTATAPLATRTICSAGNDTGYADLAADASRLIFLPWCAGALLGDAASVSPIDAESGLRLDREQRSIYAVDVATDEAHYLTGQIDATGRAVPRVGSLGNFYVGGSDDLSTVYFSTNDATGLPLIPGANPGGGLFRWRDGEKTVLFEGFDGVAPAYVSGVDRRNAIAADGELVTGYVYEGVAADDTVFGGDVYQTDGDQVTWVSRSEFTGSPEVVADKVFEGGSADGRTLFFSTTEKLVGDGVSGGDLDASQDVYVYDADRPAGARLDLVSVVDPSCAEVLSDPCDADADGVGASTSMAKFSIASDDGGEVFFITGDVLHPDDVDGQQSLYLRDLEAGTTTYLTPAGAGATGDSDGEDAANWWGSAGTLAAHSVPTRPIALSADGRTAAFLLASDVDLPSGRGGVDVDEKRDLYVWTDSDGLRRVRQGLAGDANTAVVPSVGTNLGDGGEVQLGRALTDDGRLVFFQTTDALVEGDVNERLDVYAYDTVTHVVDLISPGDAPSDAVYFDASASGDDVFFLTGQSIDPSRDVDKGHIDLYDARVGGGFAPLAEPPSCDPLADSCQGAGGDSTPAGEKTSRSTADGGNESPGARKVLLVSRPSSKARRQAARSGRLGLRVRVDAPGRVTAVAVARIGGRSRRVARGSARSTKAGKLTLRMRLSRSAHRRLQQGHGLRLVVTVASPGARSRSMTVRLPGAGS